MGFTGYWFVTTAADELIHSWRERYAAELAAAADRREQVMAWWAGQGGVAFLEDHGRDGWWLTDAGSEFVGHFWDIPSHDLAWELIDAVAEAGEPGSCHPSQRKGMPAVAFYAALGVADAARMPGHLGEFLLTADEAAAALPEIERVLGARRAELIELAEPWLQEAADPAAMAGMVDGLPRVFRHAAEQGLGVAAGSAHY